MARRDDGIYRRFRAELSALVEDFKDPGTIAMVDSSIEHLSAPSHVVQAGRLPRNPYHRESISSLRHSLREAWSTSRRSGGRCGDLRTRQGYRVTLEPAA